jgi:toxin ParE1/3/4
MPRTKLPWTLMALAALRDIRGQIAEQTEPKSAQRYLQRIKAAARRLKRFPQSGWVVMEYQDPTIREIVVGSHRIIYRYRDNIVTIMNVFHGARILRREHLESD